MLKRFSLTLLFLTCFLTQPLLAADLVTNGEASSVIVLSDPEDKDLKRAAEDLQLHIEEMSGAKLQIVDALPKSDLLPIHIGTNDPKIKKHLGEEPDEGSFVLLVEAKRVVIHGASAPAHHFAVAELLEQLGCRWFMIGEIGKVVPTMKSVSVKVQKTVQHPSFWARNLQARINNDWQKRMRLGGPYFPAAHGIANLGHPKHSKTLFEEHPDMYALIDGERKKRQICVSNPKVLEHAVEYFTTKWEKNPAELHWVGMGPNDGAGFCECANCVALDGDDWDAYSNEPSVTDRYIWFYNQFLDRMDDKFPKLRLSYYVYHNYMRPPKKHKPDPRIMPAYAPIALCRIHGPNNPICPEKSYSAKLIKEWCEQVPVLFDRGYWFNLADPGFPFSMVHRMREQIPLWHDLGIKGWRVESIIHTASDIPSHYIASKLMWDHDADVDALLADFHEKFFGPGAEGMAEYTRLVDHGLRDADHHTGCSFDMPHIFDAARRKAMNAAIAKAEAAVKGTDPKLQYEARVQMRRDSYEYLDAFVTLIESRNVHDYATSQKALDKVDSIREKLIAHDPPLLDPRASTSYMRRFFRSATEQGHVRTSGDNKLVAGLDDIWMFQLDPLKLGEEISLHKPMYNGGNWEPIKTSSSSWSNQGLRYYKGEAWYRQTVSIDKKFEGKKVFLWFGGVDEKVKVWINGELVGISPGGTFQPFEMDATDALNFGGENTIIVRLINERVNELGTGGIVSPVMLWQPADPNATPENRRPLGETFP